MDDTALLLLQIMGVCTSNPKVATLQLQPPTACVPVPLQDPSVGQSVDNACSATSLSVCERHDKNEPVETNGTKTNEMKPVNVATHFVPYQPYADQTENAVLETKPENHTAGRINSTIPPNFHPGQSQSKKDINCKMTIEKLAPIESEAVLRDQLEHLLVCWKESGQLAEVENHALSVASTQAGSIESLAAALTNPNAKYIASLGENYFHEQVAKAYAIYFWVANNITYDVKTWQAYLGGNNQCLRGEARTVLQERSSVSLGYANLYKALAMKVSLDVVVVNGSAKSWRQFSQDPDAEFAPSRLNVHSWNMVSYHHLINTHIYLNSQVVHSTKLLPHRCPGMVLC